MWKSLFLILGCYLMFFKDRIMKDNSFLKSLIPARYLISLMGLFACYCGFIYNDMMSLTLDFGTCYNMEYEGTTQSVSRDSDCVYSFGKFFERGINNGFCRCRSCVGCLFEWIDVFKLAENEIGCNHRGFTNAFWLVFLF